MQKATNKVVELKPKDDRELWEIEFERCQHWIVKALKHQDSYTLQDIEDKIREGIFHIWPGEKSVMIIKHVIKRLEAIRAFILQELHQSTPFFIYFEI